MGDEALHDLTPAYALDALDDAERREYETHLAHCEECRRELASLSDTAASLAYAADAPPPPSDLRSRILAAARSERPNVVLLRPRWAVPAAAAAAVAVAAAIALAIWGVALSNKLDSERAARAKDQRVAAVLAATDAHAFRIGDRGRLVVTPRGEAALVLTKLGRAPTGKTYEAWVANGGAPRPAGTFDAAANVTAVRLTQPVPAGATVMVTRERAGGTAAPTTKPFITVNTAS
jgi:hypothetical protein